MKSEGRTIVMALNKVYSYGEWRTYMMKTKEYYSLLKEKFPSRAQILTEIINLEAIMHLPKGTEYFISDVHGEYGAIDYLLRTASGTIEQKVREILTDSEWSDGDIKELCQLIYYPKEKLEKLSSVYKKVELEDYLLDRIPVLLEIIRYIGSKYTRSKIRKILPDSYAYIIEELLAESDQHTKELYFEAITSKIRSFGKLYDLVNHLAYVIQDLAVDHVHVVGDIFDRGKSPDLIIDRLMRLRSVDIQWGNHDIVWMGAISGSVICMLNVIRISARYNNLSLIEDCYGINIRPLVEYSQKNYCPLPSFRPIVDEGELDKGTSDLLNVVQQATAILQFKLEGQLIKRHPEFNMEHRYLLPYIDYQKKMILLKNQHYPLVDFNHSCINSKNPCELSAEEQKMLQQVLTSFQQSERLKRHMDFLLDKGSMYLVTNQLVLFHGCIPLHSDGIFKSLTIEGESYAGKKLLDFFEKSIRRSYHHPEHQDDFDTDLFWYLWTGELSPLFGKDAMTTFERYYIQDKGTHIEKRNPYYLLRENQEVCVKILDAFDVSGIGYIGNGHTPIKEKDGENPIKANRKMIVIDGGFAKGYQSKTGNAGYTLVSNSYGLELVAHRPFSNIDDVLEGKCEIISRIRLVEKVDSRKLVATTDKGDYLNRQIEDLEFLYFHFDQF